MRQFFSVAGNRNKLREVQVLISNVHGIALDLPQIQEVDP